MPERFGFFAKMSWISWMALLESSSHGKGEPETSLEPLPIALRKPLIRSFRLSAARPPVMIA